MLRRFRIEKPIWKNRSVGINLASCNPSDEIEIEILYKNKKGYRIYPYLYSITAKELHKYPTFKAHGNVMLHVIPIDKLSIKELIKENILPSQVSILGEVIVNKPETKQLKPNNMLFDNKEIEKIRKENLSRGGDDRKKIEPGEQLLTFTDLKITKSKKDNNPMLQVTLTKNPDYRPIDVYWKLAGGGSEQAKSRIVEFLEEGFHHTLTACKDENELTAQMKKYLGKQLKVAVSIETSLYDTKKGETVVIKKPKVWYIGHKDDKAFTVNMASMAEFPPPS